MQMDTPADPKGLMVWWAEMNEEERENSRALAEAACEREVTPLEAMLFLITGHTVADPESNIIDMREHFEQFRGALPPVPPS